MKTLVFVLFIVGAFAQVHMSLEHRPHRWLKVPAIQDRRTAPVSLPGGISNIGEFYATVSVGNPPQNVAVQVDTGSSDLLIYNPSCNGCGVNPDYDPKASNASTFVQCGSTLKCQACLVNPPNGCKFDDQYGDGSEVSGFMVKDKFSIAGFSASAFIGSITTASGGQQGTTFEPQGLSGIWGLAYQKLSSVNATPAFQLLAQNSSGLLPPIFSMCLKEGGGSMMLGGTFMAPNYQYTPLTTADPFYYSVNILDIQIAGSTIGVSTTVYNGNPLSPSIVDSGTTLVVLPQTAYDAFVSKMNSYCATVNLVGICNQPVGKTIFDQYCFAMNDDDLHAYPTIQVILDQAGTLAMTPDIYLYENTASGITTRCMGLVNGGAANGVILGDIFMENYEVVFDMQNNRVGFAAGGPCSNNGFALQASLLFVMSFVLFLVV